MAVKVGMVSLGCSKNQVDAEIMLALLKKGGYALCADADECDVVIVNTCGFIEDAKRESIEQILEFCQRKAQGELKVVVVTGCLAERYRQQLVEEIPEADVVLGIGANASIVEAVEQALNGQRTTSFPEKDKLMLNGERVLANENYFAYLKLADGCDNRCTYCAIPLIRGSFRSRKMEDILDEAQRLADMGVRELNVVAQDTTRYGEDLYGKLMLPELLEKLCQIDKLHWIRVLYCYPDRVTDELLEVMNREEKLVKYIDLPIQHCDGTVLSRMNRRGDRESLTALMERIREQVPGVTIRTTLITGFPGETEEQFESLCGFVKDVKFDRLGCFAYSREEDTPAASFGDQIDEEDKQRRAEVIMETQYAIMEQKNLAQVGSTLEVLAEGYDRETGLCFGRSRMDAPDIDSYVYFYADKKPRPGSFVNVRITKAVGYDLIGETTA
ncbi:30S ribosomal protein S12 methylthiotransferase RimO [Candidatus Soleaferrea massiliensis]|uniref:30S ribosomal protein S12 methylthiotransferase RimO n=1 Tax=Candidatus Soleaferrea massiliensis TaxID=1470354 RepID=UPI00058BACDA|nr:30S ribosomal protein S12 methylthiotransferase RimO [Candidatus Soleaferrea massiliensis]